MTVRTIDRSSLEDKFNIPNLAYDLFVLSERHITNPKIVEDCMMKIYGEPILRIAGEICETIDNANFINLFDEEQRIERKRQQHLAILKTRNLLTRIFIWNTRKNISNNKLSFWISSIEELQTKLRSWIKSDENRIKKGSDV